MTDYHDPDFPPLPDGFVYATDAYLPTREETVLREADAKRKSAPIWLTQADFDRVAELRAENEKRVLELRGTTK